MLPKKRKEVHGAMMSDWGTDATGESLTLHADSSLLPVT